MRLILAALLLAPALARAEDPAIAFKRFRMETVLEANGQAVQTVSIEARASTDAAARQISQQSIPYADTQEKVEIVEAAIRRADGKVIQLPKDVGRPVTEIGVVNASAFENRKRLQIVFPGFAPGDTLLLTTRRHINQPVFPGQFALSFAFSRASAWDNAEIVLNAPADMAIATDEVDVKLERSKDGKRQVLRWTYQAAAQAAEPAVLSAFDRLPRVFASTFADWPAFGKAWGALADAKLAPNDAVAKRAEAMTQGVTDKRAQATAIYAGVQSAVRVVPVPLGSGDFEPTSPQTVLERGYGDSKDMAVLTIALLRAKGIAALPVLVNSGLGYTLAKAANYANLNQVIVLLPEWSILLDPASRGTPFGSLPFQEYGKTGLRIGPDGASLMAIAPLAQRQAGERVVTNMTLAADGGLTGDSLNEATGPFAGELRRLGITIVSNGPTRMAEAQLRALGTPGQGTFAGGDPRSVGPGFAIKSQFSLARHTGWLEGEAFTLPTGMRLVHRAGDLLLGPLGVRNIPEDEPTPCYSGRQEEELSLTFPATFRIGRAPRDVRVENEAFIYQSTWETTATQIKVHRIIEVRVATALCSGKLRAQAAEALSQVRRDMNTQIWLEAK
jgi:hypothetical protein